MKLSIRHAVPGVLLAGVVTSWQASPASVARELIDADRGYAAASALGGVVEGLAPALAHDAIMPVRGAGFVRGRDSVIAALRRDTANTQARFSWAPIRAGVSADGQHGFTYGYTTLSRPGGVMIPGKYVAYWVREDGAWKLSVYRRVPRPEGDVSLAERPPALPPRLVDPVSDASVIQRFARELADTERAFSRDAKGGSTIGEAFARYGDPTAANVGGAPAFVHGADSIGLQVQATASPGSRITWDADETRVASSGDLGVNLGYITIERVAGSGQPAATVRVPFFTVWRRDDRTKPWRYIAE